MALTSTRSLGIALIVVSLLPLSNGSKLFSAQKTFFEESTASRATVVALVGAKPRENKKNSTNVYSVVEFTDNEGTRRTEQTNVGSYPAAHSIGEEIDILFHPDKREDVRIASFTGLWFESAFYLIPGLAALLGGITMVLSGRKRQT